MSQENTWPQCSICKLWSFSTELLQILIRQIREVASVILNSIFLTPLFSLMTMPWTCLNRLGKSKIPAGTFHSSLTIDDQYFVDGILIKKKIFCLAHIMNSSVRYAAFWSRKLCFLEHRLFSLPCMIAHTITIQQKGQVLFIYFKELHNTSEKLVKVQPYKKRILAFMSYACLARIPKYFGTPKESFPYMQKHVVKRASRKQKWCQLLLRFSC